MFLKILCVLTGVIVAVSAYKSYENYKVYEVVPTSDTQVKILIDLRKEGYDFWTDIFSVGSNVRIMVSPKKDEEFVTYCKKNEINPSVSISNVQKLINDQLKPSTENHRSNIGSFCWSNYHTLDEIYAWLDELTELYPNVVTTVNAGTSIEGRAIKGVVIDFKAGNREGTPLVGMIEGGIHSREWISPATVTWIIKEFLTSNNQDVRSMAENFVWHIFPVINPDGYVYSFTDDRMWRKNRNRANFVNCTNVDDDLSNGIDLNRNFNFRWMTIGASLDPCMETFAGSTAASEPETRAISNYVLSLQQTGNMIYYFAFHSYSQMVLVPYSHVSGSDVLEAENYADMYEIAIRGAEKLTQRHGTPYLVGTSADILYPVSGSSFDWVKGVVNVPIVYLFELRDIGKYGFLLPSEQIIPNNEEIMDCLIEMDKTTRQLGYYSGTVTITASFITIFTGIGFLLTSH